MIEYPDDAGLRREGGRHGLRTEVMVRDVVRVVEVLNLKRQRFFSKRSVLSGSMALRCFGSPRFTVFDADFSTNSETVDPPLKVKDLLAYEDDMLTITPVSAAAADAGGTLVKVVPIAFDPVFTEIELSDEQRQFKADVSFRKLLLDGREVPLTTPYQLDLWNAGAEETVFVMDPREAMVEKILGWSVHAQAKHYGDVAWMSYEAFEVGNPDFDFKGAELRSLLADKLAAMRKLQPDTYASFPHVDAVIGKLGQPPVLDRREWQRMVYLKAHRTRWTQAELHRIVKDLLMPRLRIRL